MKPIPLSQLIKIAPLTQKEKQDLLAKLPSYNSIQKLKITKILWKSISLTYQSFVKEKMETMLDEMAHAKAIYEKKDFKNAENEIFNKLLVKIDETQSKEEVEALKHQLLHKGS
ncbi:MAG: hypothetical protein U9Q63_00635 [Patescibacteria group bacterium]|nr:hypothetical protein [Patescibacteria group bacterium]